MLRCSQEKPGEQTRPSCVPLTVGFRLAREWRGSAAPSVFSGVLRLSGTLAGLRAWEVGDVRTDTLRPCSPAPLGARACGAS